MLRWGIYNLPQLHLYCGQWISGTCVNESDRNVDHSAFLKVYKKEKHFPYAMSALGSHLFVKFSVGFCHI